MHVGKRSLMDPLLLKLGQSVRLMEYVTLVTSVLSVGSPATSFAVAFFPPLSRCDWPAGPAVSASEREMAAGHAC
jgi:hypothetical protein